MMQLPSSFSHPALFSTLTMTVFARFPLLAVAILACADAPEEAYPKDVPRWQLVEEWRVGAAVDGPHSFDFNLGLGLLPHGGFVHYDFKSNKLHFLDSQGKAVRSVGQRGEGPGEFNVVNGLLVALDGRVIVSDLGSGFSIFSADGDYIGTARSDYGRIGTGGRWDAVMLTDGSVVENIRQAPGMLGGEVVRVHWAPDLTRADTLPSSLCAASTDEGASRIPLRNADGKILVHMPVMYAEPTKAVAVDAEGVIWEGRVGSNEIVRHGLRDCTATATIKLPGFPAPITPEQLENITAMANAEANRWQAVAPDIGDLPEKQSWYRALHTDTQGNLWVERIREDGALRVEIYSSAGAPLGEVRAASLPLGAIITATYVFGLVRDADGLAHLVAYRIVKG